MPFNRVEEDAWTRKRIEELVDLEGKIAVVTGGALGIGQATAMALAEVGAAVVIADSNLEAAYQTIGEIREKGGFAEAMYAKVSSAEDARRVVEDIVERNGALDILVNAAATFSFSAALYGIQDLWSKALSAYVKGIHYYCEAAAQKMMQAGHGGRIVNIASMDAMRPAAHPTAVGGRGNSVAQLTKALAVEFDPYKITVNALAPGVPERQSAQAQVAGFKLAKSEDESPMPSSPIHSGTEWAVAENIATVVLFLVGDAGAEVTGNLVIVDETKMNPITLSENRLLVQCNGHYPHSSPWRHKWNRKAN